MKPDISEIPVTHEGVTYIGKDLPSEAQELLQHCVALRTEREDLAFKHAQLLAAEQAMQLALTEQLSVLAASEKTEKVSNG